ncbi:PLP-dependent aminotransferase family protein [Marinibactrum halimedae]|uniref:Transcriptional regulator n=1 Tax=Marinibactrum halimedae TaxID=1444977 RepID=A0AA37T6D1_9GAMM|nr:PLP-dependent aminotransferase family protein [Marinibactrum halimedae]MCD9460665.1 PLP-dependent aminotransferase family protein [Marinibactrum halimedae]GLS24310.1 transcriptional regulator [Marinibactrum halimedae]
MTIWIPTLIDTPVPKYKALADAIGEAIDEGELSPGDKLPTHRQLADALSVTVGTITRGYAEAERRQLIESKVGSGTFVKLPKSSSSFTIQESEDPNIIDLSYSIALYQGQDELMQDSLMSISQDKPLMRRLLSYQPETGMLHHREAAQAWLEQTGIRTTDADRMIITNGGQHGFFSVTQAICRAGDTVLSAGLTYPGFSGVARQMGLKHIGLEHDNAGILPEAMRVACQRHQPRALYLNTRLNNPTSDVMTLERIHAIAEICQQYKIWVIEDDVQGCLNIPSTPCFANEYPDMTFLVSSTSKAISGGLRVGYIQPPDTLSRPVANAVKASCWMAAPLMVELASRWILSGKTQSLADARREELKDRHKIVNEKLNEFSFYSTDTGFNVWLHLPEERRAQEFTGALSQQNVLVKPYNAFAVGHFNAPQAIRFCIAGNNSRERLQKSLEIISNELKNNTVDLDYMQ